MSHVVSSQFEVLIKVHPCLILIHDTDDSFNIVGRIGFQSRIKNVLIKDDFQVKISISDKYPEELPVVIETEGRIPEKFHRNKDEQKSLCLGTFLDLHMKFYEDKTLLHFVNNCLIPYLLRFSYWEKTGEIPLGERSHGIEGIYETYYSVLTVSKKMTVVRFIIITLKGSNDYDKCPCGSGKRYFKCHKPIITKIRKIVPESIIISDYLSIIRDLIDSGIDVPSDLMIIDKDKYFKR